MVSVGLHEAGKDILALLQRIRIGDEHPDRIATDGGNVRCSRHDPDLALLDGIDAEWRLCPPNVHVPDMT